MRLEKTKTVRFKQLVAQLGTPSQYLPFNPKHDSAFKKAIEDTRVLSIKPKTPGRSEFGMVGYRFEKGVTILVFPKSLEPFRGMRVIGIDAGLFGDMSTGGKSAKTSQPQRAPSRKQQEVRHVFETKVTFVARYVTEQQISAKSLTEAKKLLTAQVEQISPDFSEGTVSRALGRIRKVR